MADSDQESQDLADQVAAVHLNIDVPIPSIEGHIDYTSDEATVSRASSHSRTPSLSLTPPPSHGSEVLDSPHSERGALAPRRTTDSIEGRLGMSTESPSGGNGPSNQRSHRTRSRSPGEAPRHNVEDEVPPQDRFHDPTFQEAFSDTRRFISELADVLASSVLHLDPDSTTRRLHEKAADLAHFRCPPTRTVGFVGDSGVGKQNASDLSPGMKLTTYREEQPSQLYLGFQKPRPIGRCAKTDQKLRY